MSDKIKEKIKAYYIGDDINKVLDCITNLQKENERLKEENNKFNSHIQSQGKLISALRDMKNIDYKSRNEKAIKLLKEAGCYEEESKQFCDDVWEELPDILSALEGSDKE